jgi:uncharacterized protein (TIGR02246 family)
MSGTERCVEGQDLAAEIEAVYKRIATAWREGNAQAVATEFAEEGDLIDPFGRPARGRDNVAKLLTANFGALFQGSLIEFRPELTRLLATDVAVSDGTWRVTLARPTDGETPPPINGRVTTVFRRVGSTWMVESDRPMLPAPLPAGASPATVAGPNR